MGEQIFPKDIPHLHNRENKPKETSMVVEKSASPSVAQLAGKFQPSHSGNEIPINKPIRRKPPCSLPLHTHKPELGHNGELKQSPNASHPPRVKVKSSPLIEKLQANLAFAPASLLPGASPKSPGLKIMTSPFHSPPSTPISPQVQSYSSESDEMPVSFDEPPEGTHLQFYNKVRTRGSIKRRPPSRRFRKSQSEFGDDQELGVTVSPQENGAKEEEEEHDPFTDKGKTVKTLVDGVDHHVKQNQVAADEKMPSAQGSKETTDSKIGTEEVTSCQDSKGENPLQKNSEEEPSETIKENKDKSADHSAAEDTEGLSLKSTLRHKEDGDASDQENEEEKEEKSGESEDTLLISDTQDTGIPPPASETDMSSEV